MVPSGQRSLTRALPQSICARVQRLRSLLAQSLSRPYSEFSRPLMFWNATERPGAKNMRATVSNSRYWTRLLLFACLILAAAPLLARRHRQHAGSGARFGAYTG